MEWSAALHLTVNLLSYNADGHRFKLRVHTITSIITYRIIYISVPLCLYENDAVDSLIFFVISFLFITDLIKQYNTLRWISERYLIGSIHVI